MESYLILAGWGGRMLGTVAAGWSYVSCEPNPETYDNLQRLIRFLNIGGPCYNSFATSREIRSKGEHV